MRKNPDTCKYLELPYSRAYQRHRFEEIQPGRTFVDRHYYWVLVEAMVAYADWIVFIESFQQTKRSLWHPKRIQAELLPERHGRLNDVVKWGNIS